MNTSASSLKPASANNSREVLKQLQQKFMVFGQAMPLSIGIDKQLLARIPTLDRKSLRSALGFHTNSLRYLKGMEKATVRFDLDGQAGEEVTEAHRNHATQLIQARFKKAAEQRKAVREAERIALAEKDNAEKLGQKLGELAAKFSR